MKQLILSGALFIISITALSQDIFTPILEEIEQNSTALEVFRQQMETEKLQNRTGLTPNNPEVEFGYLWGTPANIGTRKNISVSQPLDFPTTYIQRNKLSHLQNKSVEQNYRTKRMELLLTAKKTCIDLLFYNQLHKLYRMQYENASKIAESYRKMMLNGEANRLEYNKANLNFTSIKNELKRIDIERKRLLSELMVLNGNKPITFEVSTFELMSLPGDFNQWYTEAEKCHPSLQYLKTQVEVANRQVKLTQAEALPKMAVGYMGEFVRGEGYQGITLGVSIPLWENKNRMKQARASVQTSESAVEDSRIHYYNHLNNLYEQALELQEVVTMYTSSINMYDQAKLLHKAFEKGELSLLEYLLEMEYYYDYLQKRATAEHDLAHIIAELTSYSL